MFDDPTLVGSWPALARRLETGVLRRWADTVAELAALDTLDALLAGWADPAHTHRISTGLIRLAAADGGHDDDALLLLLHLLSGLVWRLATGLGDLSPDITTVVINELTCQIRAYRWRVRPGWLIPNLEKDTRRAVLAELRPSDRYHADRVEQLTDNGILCPGHRLAFTAPAEHEDIDVVDLLLWAAAHGVAEDDLQLLVASEGARGPRGARADATVAQSCGIAPRTLLRRRERTLTALRGLAPAYLTAVA